MAKLKNIHPGEVLLEEFLLPLNISAYKLTKDIEIPLFQAGSPAGDPAYSQFLLY